MFDKVHKYAFYLDKNIRKSLELFLLLHWTEQYINGAIIEMDRIERSRKNINKEIQYLTNNKNMYKRKLRPTYIFFDIHFFYICIDKCYKLIGQLAAELNNKEIKALKERINKTFDIKSIRNHFEHIEDRCVGYNNLEDSKKRIKREIIHDFGTSYSDAFSFDNKKYPCDKKSLQELKKIYKELICIIERIAKNNPDFTRRMEAEKEHKSIEKALRKAGLIH